MVNDVSSLDEPWPLIGGLPFPEGRLHDPGLIRIMCDGEEVPAQIDVAARWLDGSIRWALVGLTGSPQGRYHVEFGPAVSRALPPRPLKLHEDGGRLTVDTGAALYEFEPDQLLPDSLTMDGVTIFAGAGAGAYLVDNQGRTARVSGDAAEITSEVIKSGPLRMVLRREGWYVNKDGERFARARVWFYLAAGSPALRVTHSLVFTEDTNDLWVRDYGLEFNTPTAPTEVAFAVSEPPPADAEPRPAAGRSVEELEAERRHNLAELYSAGLYASPQNLFKAAPEGDEVYMLQDRYPHALERDFRAVIARTPASNPGGNLFTHDWLACMEVAGDWGEARYATHSLALVLPQLAPRFPKEIAFSPQGARLAFWSGRSGRELDFRSVTLVNEYWQKWSHSAFKAFRSQVKGLTRSERAADIMAAYPSNARGAARTHDAWLLPRVKTADDATLKQRAAAASYQPLLLADPVWLTATAAVGWPMHPEDYARFPEAEAGIDSYWNTLMGGQIYNAGLRRAGFIMWGQNVNLHGPFSWFRISRMTDYGLRRSVWGLFARSGHRRYYDYAARFNRFAGDWELGHWNAGGKFKGGFVSDANNDVPLHWGSTTDLRGSTLDITGHSVVNWLLEHYLTGDEYALELVDMLAEAYKERGDAEMDRLYISHINVLSEIYAHTHDPEILRLAQAHVDLLIDEDNPVGLSDENINHGVFYKTHRSQMALYDYYQATGDERAREAFLRSIDYKYRFHHLFDRRNLAGTRGPFARSYSLLLYSVAYLWTGRPAYLQVINRQYEEFLEGTRSGVGGGLIGQMNSFLGLPTALKVLADASMPIQPFPLLETDAGSPLTFSKAVGQPVDIELYVRTADRFDKNTVLTPVVRPPSGVALPSGSVDLVVEQMYTQQHAGRQDPRRWSVRLTMPAQAPAGSYIVEIPQAATIAVLAGNVAEMAFHAVE
ncbi:MAG: hypothetical protein ABR497_09035 [Kiritimatiellia bacterium]|nr:D-glucuronyl C5-epimerase family protein [Lentisphaerota bacterium]